MMKRTKIILICFAVGIYLLVVATLALDKLLPANDPSHVSFLEDRAKEGDATAQYDLAVMYDMGDKEEGITKDEDKALQYYLKAATSNHAESQSMLGLKFTGVDEKKAVYWLKRATENDDLLGLTLLARRYEIGNGVQQNKLKAAELYEKAVKKGDVTSTGKLGLLYIDGVAGDEKKQKGYNLLSEACRKGYNQLMIVGLTAMTPVCSHYGLQ